MLNYFLRLIFRYFQTYCVNWFFFHLTTVWENNLLQDSYRLANLYAQDLESVFGAMVNCVLFSAQDLLYNSHYFLLNQPQKQYNEAPSSQLLLSAETLKHLQKQSHPIAHCACKVTLMDSSFYLYVFFKQLASSSSPKEVI